MGFGALSPGAACVEPALLLRRSSVRVGACCCAGKLSRDLLLVWQGQVHRIVLGLTSFKVLAFGGG